MQELHEKYFKELKEIEKQPEINYYDNQGYGWSSGGGGGQKVVYSEKKNPKPMFEMHGEKKTEKVDEEENREYNSDNGIKLDFSLDRNKNAAKINFNGSKMSKIEVY